MDLLSCSRLHSTLGQSWIRQRTNAHFYSAQNQIIDTRASVLFNCMLIMLYNSNVFLRRIPNARSEICINEYVQQYWKCASTVLRHINVSKESAFMHFNLIPLTARRQIAMLDCTHKTTQQRGQPNLQELFRGNPSPDVTVTRTPRRHISKALNGRETKTCNSCAALL